MSWTLAQRTEDMNPSVIREILRLTERPGVISSAGGLPSPATFPVEAMREVCVRVLRDEAGSDERARQSLQYAASEGYAPLREWVAGDLRRQSLRPAGGMFLWLQLPAGLDAGKLLPKVVAHGVAFVPGAPFFAGAPQPRSLRLSFVTASAAQIETGIAALAQAIEQALEKAR